MLELKNITKVYEAGTTQVEALKGIDIAFRESEFVAILGQSGCGKTTLLNIIGGLDRYTSGDLIINGRSTKEYDDRDWDTYRNHSIGFVFQSYNLIALGRLGRGAACARRRGAGKGRSGRPARQGAEPDVRRPDAARGHRARHRQQP